LHPGLTIGHIEEGVLFICHERKEIVCRLFLWIAAKSHNTASGIIPGPGNCGDVHVRGLSELFRTEDVRLHETYHVNALAARQSHNISMPRKSVSAEAETPTPQLFGLKQYAFGSFLASK
jgi:hypothetical protein